MSPLSIVKGFSLITTAEQDLNLFNGSTKARIFGEISQVALGILHQLFYGSLIFSDLTSQANYSPVCLELRKG